MAGSHGGWNRGLRAPLTKCRRHRTQRERKGSGKVFCRLCENEAKRAWNARNPEKLAGYKAKFYARHGGSAAYNRALRGRKK